MSKGTQIAIGYAASALLLVAYGWSRRDDLGLASYYQTVEEFLEHRPVGEPVRVHGYVAPGSIARNVAARRVDFDVVTEAPHARSGGGGGPRLRVSYGSLATPDLFGDGAEVVIEGSLAGGATGIFHADNVLAKCPSKFSPETQQSTSL